MTYDTVNYGLIRDQLVADHKQISDNNRAQMLDDAFILASIEMLPYAQALDLTLYLKYEQEYVPWHAVLSELNYIDIMLHNFAEFADWKVCSWLRNNNNSKFEYLTHYFINIDLHDELSHTLLQFCRIQRNPCRSSSYQIFPYRRNELGLQTWSGRLRSKFTEQLRSPYEQSRQSRTVNEIFLQFLLITTKGVNAGWNRIISVNDKSIVLRTAIENGGQIEYDFAFEQYKTKVDTSFLTAMCASKQSAILYG